MRIGGSTQLCCCDAVTHHRSSRSQAVVDEAREPTAAFNALQDKEGPHRSAKGTSAPKARRRSARTGGVLEDPSTPFLGSSGLNGRYVLDTNVIWYSLMDTSFAERIVRS